MMRENCSPDTYAPSDQDLLDLVLRNPMITVVELGRLLWPELPYRALPGLDSASETVRRWQSGGPQTAARWLQAQLRRLVRAGQLSFVAGDKGSPIALVSYLPAGLTLYPRVPLVEVADLACAERLCLPACTPCLPAPRDLDPDAAPYASVRRHMGLLRARYESRKRVGKVDYHAYAVPLGQAEGRVLAPSDPDTPGTWWLLDVLTPLGQRPQPGPGDLHAAAILQRAVAASAAAGAAAAQSWDEDGLPTPELAQEARVLRLHEA